MDMYHRTIVCSMRYHKAMYEQVKRDNPDVEHMSEINRIIGRMWSNLNDTDKEEFMTDCQIEKVS